MLSTDADSVVITGMGAICAAGDVSALWRCALQGTPQARWFRHSESSGQAPVPACAVTRDLRLEELSIKRVKRLDRSVQLALLAARDAIADAALEAEAIQRLVTGVIAGTSRGPAATWSSAEQRLHDGRSLPPSLSTQTTLGCLSGAVAQMIGARGMHFTVSATCASAAHALALAAQQIQEGAADIMLAGGADAPLHAPVIEQLRATGILGSADDPAAACRPFDLKRNGTVLGEGAGFLVLERRSAAIRRGARIHATLAGWAMGTDPAHETGPCKSAASLVRVMSQAASKAQLRPRDIGYLNLHGTGTRLHDQFEAGAVTEFAMPTSIRSSSTKAVTGHCLGATPALEAVICLLALRDQLLPPSANCQDPDPSCPLDLVLHKASRAVFEATMSISAGFWGTNAALVFRTP